MGSSKGKTRRRRENFAILGPLNGDFTRENGQNRGPKVAKIRTLTDPPPCLARSGPEGGVSDGDNMYLLILRNAKG